MARRPTRSQTSRFRSLILGLEPAMRRAFNQAVSGLYQAINWRALLDALTRGDIEGAVSALNIDAGAFGGLYQAHQAAYFAGASETVATLTISGVSRADAVGIRFDMTNPRAESMLATSSSSMIQQITEDTRNAVRETITAGYAQGRGPRDIATDIAGRVVDGRRQGGVLGLDANRAHRLLAVKDGIKTPEGVRDLVIKHKDGTYSLRYKVNADTEKRIMAAYRKGTAVSESGQKIIADRFGNSLLKHRADTVAQVETAQAVMAGRREEWAQVCAKLGRDPSEVVKTFQHGAGGKDPRWWHAAANGMQVLGIDTPFQLANGSSLQFAHDPAAPASEVIGCTCDTTFRILPKIEDLR